MTLHASIADLRHTSQQLFIGKLKAFIPLTHGPLFGMDFIDYFGWYWEGGGHELLNEAYQQRLKMSVVSFQVHPEGPQAMGWFKKEIHRFKDIKGQRYRIYAAGAEVYNKLGIAFLLGWPCEWPAIVLVFVPLLQSVVMAMKHDRLWFARLIAVNLQTAFLSSPVAMSAYYLKGVAPNGELRDIYRGMGQFMVLQLIRLALCIIFPSISPSISLWFPRWLFGK
jgi:hypothetical protein